MSLHIDDHVDLWVDHKTAIDTIEPIPDRHDELRDYALRSVEILNGFSAWLEKPIVAPSGTKQSIAIAFYQAAFALGLTAVNSDTMTSVAARLGVSRATISKGAVTFAQAHGL